MTLYVYVCPNCGRERPLSEAICEATTEGAGICGFPLLDAPIVEAGRSERASAANQSPERETAEDAQAAQAASRKCPNGHPIEDDQVLCLICGETAPNESAADVADAASQNGSSRYIGDWRLIAPLPEASTEAELFLARADGADAAVLLRHYQRGIEPETAIYPAFAALDEAHAAPLLAHGRDEGRAFEVWRHIEGPTLAELAVEIKRAPELLHAVAAQLIAALAALEEKGLRHGGVKPAVVRARSRAPLDLVLTDFATATLAEFDVEIARTRQATRYVSPEAVAGASTAASDWWSLGIVLLELLTDGKCFEGAHDRAFLLHLVTRGVAVPQDTAPDWRELLQGLLTRDHSKRWRASEAMRWAAGERGIPTSYEANAVEAGSGPSLAIGSRRYTAPALFALAAAEEENWAEALALLESGAVATWLENLEPNSQRLVKLRKIRDDSKLGDDQRLALALAVLNEDLPLCVRGKLVLPNSILVDPALGSSWLEAAPQRHLRGLKRDCDQWLVKLADRADRVRGRAKDLKLKLVDERFSVMQLCPFNAPLEAQWRQKREMFPDAATPAIGALIDRRSFTDEDLLLLVCAEEAAFRSTEEVLADAATLAQRARVPEFDPAAARQIFAMARRDVFGALNERLTGFTRTGRELVDEWAEAFRLERRTSLAKAVVLMAVPADAWKEPPHQDYVGNVLGFLEKKVLAGVQRGPLVQLRTTRSGARIDILDMLDAQRCGALLDAIIGQRGTHSLGEREEAGPGVLDRLRKLDREARTYRRDSGVNALVLGFPILVVREQKTDGSTSVKIAPAILWPIQITMEHGASGSAGLGFDLEREVQLNPAFEGILGAPNAVRWQSALQELISGTISGYAEVLDRLEDLAPIASRTLVNMPLAKAAAGKGKPQIVCAGAVFLADFASQAIAQDLRALRAKTFDSTALATLLRLVETEPLVAPKRPPEIERFSTLETDPSQEKAVLCARQTPGILLQGPPGTGKSQTIVNIVTDCLGRGETVLVVCEKQAALEVVHKRLAAEGLDHRAFRVENTTSDRGRLLRDLRAQVPELFQRDASRTADVRTERAGLAARVDQVEAALDAHHNALYARNPQIGMSYREVLSRIGAERERSADVSAPGLRDLGQSRDLARIQAIAAECSSLAEIWLAGDVEDSPLAVFKAFPTDSTLADRLKALFGSWREADESRNGALQGRSEGATSARVSRETLEVADPPKVAEWFESKCAPLRNATPRLLARVRRWRPFFAAGSPHRAQGEQQQKALAELIQRLKGLAPVGAAALLAQQVEHLDQPALEDAELTGQLFGELSFWVKINPFSPLARAKARKAVAALGLVDDDQTCVAFADAARLELDKREAMEELQKLVRSFAITDAPTAGDLDSMIAFASALASDLEAMRVLAESIDACPLRTQAWDAAAQGALESVSDFLAELGIAEAVARARAATLSAVEALGPWLEPVELDLRRAEISADAHARIDFGAVEQAFPKLIPFQTFRLRLPTLSSEARAVFAELAAALPSLRALEPQKLRETIVAVLVREAAYTWKQQIEASEPKLLQTRQEIESQIDELDQYDSKMREANRHVLAEVETGGLSAQSAWANVWALTGARALRLRQVVEKGRDLGLFKARPIWLVNPDVASRIFPLEAGLFDVVVFDEASQMRVPNAVPSLFRARRCVVSGDDKQLPPTNFFGTRIETDEEEEDDDWLEAAEAQDAEAEALLVSRRETAANRRQVKDCENLLQLADGVLHPAKLDVHYRSAYRELIAFSNAAYYEGRLNVPVQRPPEDVARHRPIEIKRVDGVYKSQTNPEEAAAIVEFLAEKWNEKMTPPTIGVVTFNKNQADLIAEAIRKRAETDRRFEIAYEHESKRSAQGEDVGFFVKNLENVQGDEREWIIVSTTFGPDSKGDGATFRKNFGALSQSGGERRLNVAITRAKEKVLLFTSIPTAKLVNLADARRSPTLAREYFEAYLRYAGHLSSGAMQMAEDLLTAFPQAAAGSRMSIAPGSNALVNDAFSTLKAAGFEANLADAVDAFSVDVTVMNPKTGLYALGVELDSRRDGLLASARARDIWRRKLIARSGMQLHRIMSSSWVDNPREERARLIDAARRSMQEIAA